MRPAVMRKVQIYLPQEHIKIIKEIAKHEGITFAEMTRRCLHLGLRAIVEDHAAFLKVVEAAQKTKAASMAAQVPPSGGTTFTNDGHATVSGGSNRTARGTENWAAGSLFADH